MIVRPRPPIWLAAPTRYAGLSRGASRIVLVSLLMLVVGLTVLALRVPVAAPLAADTPTDIVLYQQIVDGVRHGGGYYQVAADALRSGGYPMRPFVTFRLPTLAVVQAALPIWASATLLYVLAAGTFMAWSGSLLAALPRRPARVAALMLLVGGMIVHLQLPLMGFHEVWAGLLIALSLALRRRGYWIEAVALALAAMLIRETAALYVVVMAVFALADGARREAAGWGVALVVFAGAVAAHAHAVAQVVGPLDPSSPGWSALLGPGFAVHTIGIASALAVLPMWLAAPLVVLALAGWSAWVSPLAHRTLAVLLAYVALLALFARADTFYWGLMIAPLVLIGLAFLPDALRDLAATAFDTRRITVTRVTR
ncbi:hypothetical protein ASE75_11820 [Sphingomonas sp. Leaf17]|uniref:hypothetical protein n=1 Tax=Sphingomonas sp. Leaf17 TaxID=1735683 RepID=UPI0006F98F53|nr:hypothetical protein [Sphingomonas sp. Leaf17]KQM63774.1 hypothetical protein ASE75_11820 [Sphingomonas sp. Leaf17]